MPDYLKGYRQTQEDLFAAEIHKIYTDAAGEARDKIRDFLARHKKKAAILQKQVDEGKMTAAAYKAWLRGQVFQGRQWRHRLKDITEVYTKADTKARAMLNRTRLDIFSEAANFTAYSIARDLRGSVTFNLYDTRTVSALLRDKPKVLPEWKIDEPKDYRWNERRVQTALVKGIAEGASIPDIGRKLTEDLATDNAVKMNMFARTSMTAAQNAGRMERLRETEDMGIDVRKQWLAAHDSRTRDTHAALDGQTRRIDEPFQIDGMKIDYPGDPLAPPELVYNCRCTMIYVYPGLKSSHTAHKFESYAEWKERTGGGKNGK